MIRIYKTNIETISQIEKISNLLDELIGILNWNFDLEDCDKILRVDSNVNFSMEILNIFESNGFIAIELF